MKYYAVSGRIPGDDEDTMLCVGQHPNNGSAIASFMDEMRALYSLTPQDSEIMRKSYDTDVFINSIVSSDTPITNEA